MQASFSFLLIAISLGLTAGISPGPLLTLVVSETLKYGKKEGIKLALVPLITDLPIVFLSVLFLAKISGSNLILGIISALGAIFLLYLAYGSIFFRTKTSHPEHVPKSLQRGIITNFLSPHPYLFWIFVGGNLLIEASEVSNLTAVIFVTLFYGCLTGSKIMIAILTQKFKRILSMKGYLITIRLLGIALLLLAVDLFIKSVNYIF
jgi:threonine/homoserine/homoserine lactone efflux protein